MSTLKLTNGSIVEEFLLLNNLPTPPYLKVTQNETVGYVQLNTSGTSKFKFNGLYPVKTIDPNALAPSKVTNLICPSKTNTTVTLTWDFLTDASNLKSFSLYKDATVINELDKNIRTFTIEGLKVNTLYTFRLSSMGLNGKNSALTSLSVRTLA